MTEVSIAPAAFLSGIGPRMRIGHGRQGSHARRGPGGAGAGVDTARPPGRVAGVVPPIPAAPTDRRWTPSTPDRPRTTSPRCPGASGTGSASWGPGFIVRDCHLVAYADAGFQVVGLTSRTEATAREVAALRGVATVFGSVEAMLDDPEVEVVDVAVPPLEQPGVIRRILAHPRKPAGHPGAEAAGDDPGEARSLVEACEAAGVRLQVNQNMRYDHSVRVLKGLLDRGDLGEPVLATIEMRAIPHWMPWAEGGRSLSTYIMSIHHLDTFRYWLGDPARVLASTRPDPRTKFPHDDGINLYILEYADGARASAWDDVWAGPAREGAGSDIAIRWRVEGTRGLALGTIGWPAWPERVPSTIDYSTVDDHGPGTAPGGPRPGSPTPSPGRWPASSAPSRTTPSPTSPAATTSKTLALCEAVLAAGRSIGWWHSRSDPPMRPSRTRHPDPRAPIIEDPDHDGGGELALGLRDDHGGPGRAPTGRRSLQASADSKATPLRTRSWPCSGPRSSCMQIEHEVEVSMLAGHHQGPEGPRDA